ncbi:alkaline shock response membrane anchor protein AmaP [Fodinisporobacter ferrooxydans]|uniref:Alkaline shock response membrane anchor protein AmaP n=1 Tax=Fodinisporobacter ferrooxydans TaxID=2901836 RepID=A0ABY4CLI3_9BACL|nr:alkaline shock response membrane anchor protein AmaP [Alicyclobacillaceae bacterium MYW30-H2]
MNILDRIVLCMYAIIVGLASALLAFHGYGGNLLLHLLAPLQGDMWTFASGIVMFLLSIRFLFMRGKKTERFSSFVQRTTNGDVNISYQTLESLAIRAAQSMRGLAEMKASIIQAEGGIAIKIRGLVQPDLNVPTLTEQLQEKVRTYVQDTTGIHVRSVTVSIRDIVNGQSVKRNKSERIRVE